MSIEKKVVGAAIISKGRILLVNNSNFFIPVGGKIKAGETDEECLRREGREELSGTELKNLRFYKDFRAITPTSRKPFLCAIYLADIDGLLGNASAEISGYVWMPYSSRGRYRLSDATRELVESLHTDGLF